MSEPVFGNVSKGLCVVCNSPVKVEGYWTCSKKCHDEFLRFGIRKFGDAKKVVDITTGTAYKVPTKDIIEKGLAWEDLTKYSVWED